MAWGMDKMGDNIDRVKGFIGLTILAPLAGAAIGTVGAIGGLSSGVRGATQVAIGGGLLGSAAKIFKF